MSDYQSAPWLSSYGDRKFNLEYPTGSISTKVLQTADECASLQALSYMGRSISYKTLKQKILQTANAFVALGVKPGDMVTVCLPNVPQAVYSLYALNYIGAVASMIHPLSAEGEIVFYLNTVKSKYCITLDMFEKKFANILDQTSVEKIVIGGVDDELATLKKCIYRAFL
ncbi:MAG: acyl--CoA ligase, partial [Clostridia bacterium]|nr:acyl--CoA ligase [Clostridia bacterium]